MSRRFHDSPGRSLPLAPHKDFAQHARYEYIRLRLSDVCDTTLRDVIAAPQVNHFLAPDKPVTLYFVQSPVGGKCLFAIDADGRPADVIDQIGRDQARARWQAVKWLLISIPLCLVLIGLIMLPLAIRGLILLAKAPKPKDMRAFLAAHPPAQRQATAAAVA